MSNEIELGDKLDVFKPMVGNIVAGFILSALLIAASAAAIAFPLRGAYERGWQLPFEFVNRGWSWPTVGLFVLLGIGLAAGGVFLLYYATSLISRRVEFYADGFCVYAGRRSELVLWTDVDQIRETILYERPPILKGPAKLILPEFASRFFAIHTTSGNEYQFDGNSVKALRHFAEILRETSDRLSIPWQIVEMQG